MYIYRRRLSTFAYTVWFQKKAHMAKVYAFFLLWFLTGLVAHLNIFPLDATVAERWFYLPFVGILGIIGVLVSLVKNKRVVYIGLMVIICLFGARSYMRATDWGDPYRLYSHDILVSKNSASLENNYGSLLFEQGNLKEAEVHYRNAIKLGPHSPIYWSNLAEVYEAKRNYKKAEEYYLDSIKHGRFYIAFEKYASLLIRQGKKKEAKEFLEKKGLKSLPYNVRLKNLYDQVSRL